MNLISMLLFKFFYKEKQPIRFCTTCGFEGKVNKVIPGSGWIELVLWLLLLLPGVIYSTWRIIRRTQHCPDCGSTELVFTTSRTAIAARKKLNKKHEAPLLSYFSYSNIRNKYRGYRKK